MGTFNDISIMPEISDMGREDAPGFNKHSMDKFDKLMGDDKIENNGIVEKSDCLNLTSSEREIKFNRLFGMDDITEKTEDAERRVENSEQIEQETIQEEVRDSKTYCDDNGKAYREGNELIPDNEYEINGYKYRTDDNGRIVSAEGILHLKNREGRLPIKDSIEDIGKGDEKENDDRGHLIGDQFDGSNGMENMVPQDATINRNEFKNFENELAKEVKDGKEVYFKVEPIYNEDSKRPLAIGVTYIINGEESVRVFPNGEEG